MENFGISNPLFLCIERLRYAKYCPNNSTLEFIRNSLGFEIEIRKMVTSHLFSTPRSTLELFSPHLSSAGDNDF